MVAIKDGKSPIYLACDTFIISGRLSAPPEWYEFDLISNGSRLENIGGQAKSVFIGDLLDILKNQNGKPLRQMPNAVYKEVVGGDDAEYLGHVALSGYNTFYFFREDQRLIHVVFADSEGEMIAHSRFDIQVFHDWYRQLTDNS